MRIGHFQTFVADDFSANLAKFVEGLERAQRDRVEIVSFPECFLTGCAHSLEHTRQVGIAADSSEMMRAIDATSRFDATAIVGFGEMRAGDYYNSAAVLHKGHLLGIYRKCSAYESWERQGREFPVFERDGVKFGVILCSDGGYIEPTRILAMQGAQIVFAPHNNHIDREYLLEHYRTVRSDHTARAVENCIFFVRGNNYTPKDPKRPGGAGYGDSYVVDPFGEIACRSNQFQEHFIFADVDLALARDRNCPGGRSLWSWREFGKILAEAAADKT